MDLSAFRLRHPEFDSASDGLVDEALTAAALRVHEDTWGDRYDEAHGLQTAHLLWTSPFGAGMRAEGGGDSTKSRYIVEFARLRREVVSTIIVT